LLQVKGVWVATDKLGSVRANSNGETFAYFPYGEERANPTTPDGREKFATYTRDGFGQDYAEQRYYNANMGAFWSPDPGGIKTANPKNPSSWNRYAYTKGNPIGRFDPHGLWECDPDDDDGCCDDDVCCDEDPDDPECQQPGGGGEGGGGSGGGGGGGGCGAPGTICVPQNAPPCAQNQALAGQALNNIVGAVGQVLSSSGLFSQATINTIEGDLTANETAAGDVGFVGGHFNLVLSSVQIAALGTAVAGDVAGLFVGGVDGSASGVFGLGANGPRHDLSGGTSLHSQGVGPPGNQGIDFHIDLGNPYTDVAGIIGHLGRDWLPPRMPFAFGRKPCLDAPFTSGGSH
jgi:RHS repeat-associated protein